MLKDQKGHWPKSLKEFRITGGVYSVQIVRDEEGRVCSMYNGTAEYLRSEELDDEDMVRNAAGSKAMTMKKIENKLMKNIDEETIGEMTLNQIQKVCYGLGQSEKAALLSKIACYVGLF
jgi:hypothetical protein